MSPTGIEPATTVPETVALSTELRGLWHNHTINFNATQPVADPRVCVHFCKSWTKAEASTAPTNWPLGSHRERG